MIRRKTVISASGFISYGKKATAPADMIMSDDSVSMLAAVTAIGAL